MKNIDIIIAFACDTVKSRFPLGGLNRRDISLRIAKHLEINGDSAITPEKIQDMYTEQVSILQDIRTQFWVLEADIVELKGILGASCDHLVIYAAKKIHEKFGVRAEIAWLNTHKVVIIDRPLTSDPLNVNDWGDATYFYDPWGDHQHGLTRNFAEYRREQALDIAFDRLQNRIINGKITTVVDVGTGKEYLSGELCIDFYTSTMVLYHLSSHDYQGMKEQYFACIAGKYKVENTLENAELCLRRATHAGDYINLFFLLFFFRVNMNALSPVSNKTALNIALEREQELLLQWQASPSPAVEKILMDITNCKDFLNENGAKTSQELPQYAKAASKRLAPLPAQLELLNNLLTKLKCAR